MNEKRKNGRVAALVLSSAACFLLLSSCALPEAREIEGMKLLRTMGVDAAEDGVKVTVSTGAQSKGQGGGKEAPAVFSQTAGTISAACLAMQGEGDAYLFYGHVGQLLADEELARQGLGEVLGYIERDIEMRLDTEIYVVRGATAETAIQGAATEDGAAQRLEAMAADAGLTGVAVPRSAREILESLERSGAALVPALVAAPKDGGARELKSAGYAILKGGALAGWAEGDAALGASLLLGKTADILEAETGAGTVALRLVGARTAVRPVFEGDVLTGVEVDCAAEANVAEAPTGLELGRGNELDDLQETLAAACERRIRAALELAQRLDADYLGLCSKAGLAAPWRWADLQAQWADRFADLPITIKVEGTVQRSYDVKQ